MQHFSPLKRRISPEIPLFRPVFMGIPHFTQPWSGFSCIRAGWLLKLVY